MNKHYGIGQMENLLTLIPFKHKSVKSVNHFL